MEDTRSPGGDDGARPLSMEVRTLDRKEQLRARVALLTRRAETWEDEQVRDALWVVSGLQVPGRNPAADLLPATERMCSLGWPEIDVLAPALAALQHVSQLRSVVDAILGGHRPGGPFGVPRRSL